MATEVRDAAPLHLSGHHKKTYEAIFRHPVAHNLEWHDVRSLLEAVAEVTEGHNDAIQATRNGRTVIVHPPNHHKSAMTVDDLLAVRRFLEQSGETVGSAAVASGIHLLVVIDHHEAKIYRTELQGAVPQTIVPYDPHGFGRHLRTEVPETDGKREPERKSFYEAIAATLRGAEKVLLFGSGTGKSNAMEQLIADLKHNHGDLAKHIVGSVVIDAHHLTEGQLLAKAREFFE